MTRARIIGGALSLVIAGVMSQPGHALHGGAFIDSKSQWEASSDHLGRGTAVASAAADHGSGEVRVLARADQASPAGLSPSFLGTGAALTIGSSAAEAHATMLQELQAALCAAGCTVTGEWYLSKALTSSGAQGGGGPASTSGATVDLVLELTVRPKACGDSVPCFEVRAQTIPAGPGAYELKAAIPSLQVGTVVVVEAMLLARAQAWGQAFANTEAEGFVTAITFG